MRFFGIILMVVGLLGIILPFAGAGLYYFNWADQWGQAAGFGIRAGFVILGFLLWRFAPKR